MFARLVFFIAVCLGLAVAPVRSIANCATLQAEFSCQSCCATPDAACCEFSSDSQTPAAPAKIVPASGDAKQFLAPTLILLGVAPSHVAEPPSVHHHHAARIPAPPLVSKTCIRLV